MELQNFKTLKTERLNLREIVETDCNTILFLRSDKTVNKFIERPAERQIHTKSDAINYIKRLNKQTKENKSISWGITLQDSLELIGTICLWNFNDNCTIAEVGYDLKPSFQNKGIMYEALNCILNLGFNTLHLNQIEAFTHFNNVNSLKLLKKNGFTVAEKRKDSQNSANVILELLSTNYKSIV